MILTRILLYLKSARLPGPPYDEDTATLEHVFKYRRYKEGEAFFTRSKMTDPVTAVAAGTIVNLAFQKFAEAGATELAKKFTEAGIKGIDTLWAKIRERLWSKSPKVNEALMKVEGGDAAALETISKNLDVLMDEDEEFAAEVRQLAQNITLNVKQGDNAMNLTVLGGNAWQTTVSDGGVANQAGVINQYYGKPER